MDDELYELLEGMNTLEWDADEDEVSHIGKNFDAWTEWQNYRLKMMKEALFPSKPWSIKDGE